MKVYIYNEMELLWSTISSFTTFSFTFFSFPVFFFCHIATFKEDCFSIEYESTFEQSHNCNMVLNPMSEEKRPYLYIRLKRLILIESYIHSVLLVEWYTTIYGTQIPMDHQKSKTEEMFCEKENVYIKYFFDVLLLMILLLNK